MPVTVIAGPPCSGKTTLARHLAAPDHVVLDFDEIAVRLGSGRRWLHSPAVIAAANQRMQLALTELAARDDDVTAWVIRAAPRPAVRERLARALNARVWVLDPGMAECLRRARRGRPYGTDREIRKWYRMFGPSAVDEPCPHVGAAA